MTRYFIFDSEEDAGAGRVSRVVHVEDGQGDEPIRDDAMWGLLAIVAALPELVDL